MECYLGRARTDALPHLLKLAREIVQFQSLDKPKMKIMQRVVTALSNSSIQGTLSGQLRSHL